MGSEMTVQELIDELVVLAAKREGHNEFDSNEVVIRLDDREYAFHPVRQVSFEYPNRIVLHAHDDETEQG
jgi:hypothetical protein